MLSARRVDERGKRVGQPVSAVKSPSRSAAVGTTAPVTGAPCNLAQTGIAEEEEGLVVLDGATKGSAEVIAVERGLEWFGIPRISIEVGIAVELEQAAMELVCFPTL